MLFLAAKRYAPSKIGEDYLVVSNIRFLRVPQMRLHKTARRSL